MSVEALRKSFKVWVTHRRAYKGCPQLLTKTEATKLGFTELVSRPEFSKRIQPHIATTTVAIYDKESNTLLSEAIAECSRKDNFNRKRGTHIALSRAIKHWEANVGKY